MQDVVSVLADTALITLVLALAAFGLAIVYGLIGVINMGHGAMLTLGAYFTWWCTQQGLPLVPAVLLSALAVGAIGLAFEHAIIRHFYGRPFDTLLLTWAFFLVATEVIKLLFGTDFRNVPNPLEGAIDLGIYRVPAYRTAIGGVSIVIVACSALVLYRTSLGIKVRAMIQNREVASLLGLDIAAMYKLVFAGGAFMAGLAGGLIAPMYSVDPYMGNTFLVRSFFVVIVGGIGQILAGTLFGSFAIGGLETVLAPLFSDQVIAQIAVFFIAVVILRFRPQGVFTGR